MHYCLATQKLNSLDERDYPVLLKEACFRTGVFLVTLAFCRQGNRKYTQSDYSEQD